MDEVDLSRPLRDLVTTPRADGRAFHLARILVHFDAHPLGLIDVELYDGRLAAGELACVLDSRLRTSVNRFLLAHGGVLVSGLSPDGLSGALPQEWDDVEPADFELPTISVIVNTHGRPTLTSVCIDRILTLDYPKLELVVVDSSPLGTGRAAADAHGDDDRLRYWRAAGSPGARQRNLAALEAKGEVLAFIENELLVDHRWLRRMARGFRRAEGVGMARGFTSAYRLATPQQLLFDRAVLRPDAPGLEPWVAGIEPSEDPLLLDQLPLSGSGSNMAITRDCFEAMKGFDEGLSRGFATTPYENLDLTVRAISAGARLAYEPSALAMNTYSGSHRQLRHLVFEDGASRTAIGARNLSAGSMLGSDFRRLPASESTRSRESDTSSQLVPVEPVPLKFRALSRAGRLWGHLRTLRTREAST